MLLPRIVLGFQQSSVWTYEFHMKSDMQRNSFRRVRCQLPASQAYKVLIASWVSDNDFQHPTASFVRHLGYRRNREMIMLLSFVHPRLHSFRPLPILRGNIYAHPYVDNSRRSH
tara:strand:- start:384 stop:725 length:342 start_codon:yes stop_codon:yes gene_type:complete